MKKLLSLLLAALMLFMTACANTENLPADTYTQWQEQYDLGMRFMLDGNYEEAIIAFQAAIEIEPKNSDAYMYLAKVYILLGDYESAIAVLQQGIDQTNSEELRNYLNSLSATTEATTITTEATTQPEAEEPIADITWTFKDGVLTISGEGRMPDYGHLSERAPWGELDDEITTVYILDGITSIGELAFYNCTSLTSVTIPNSVTYIENEAFYYCTNLTSIVIPNSVTSIGYEAFNCCWQLTSISIPESVVEIGARLFYNCSALVSIIVAEGNPNYCSSDGILFNKDMTELIAYPNGKSESHYTVPMGVVFISDDAFSSCDNLTSITLPNSITDIGGLAFSGCVNLTSVTIPNSVINIGVFGDAFQDCNSLISVIIPESVVNMGHTPFTHCRKLELIMVSDENLNYCSKEGVLFTKDMTELICYPDQKGDSYYKIPDGVTGIGWNAFYNCDLLASVIIPDSVTGISTDAFRGCDNLTSITIPDSVMFIGDGAFSLCKNLTSYVKSGSYAEQYMIENDIKYIAE